MSRSMLNSERIYIYTKKRKQGNCPTTTLEGKTEAMLCGKRGVRHDWPAFPEGKCEGERLGTDMPETAMKTYTDHEYIVATWCLF